MRVCGSVGVRVCLNQDYSPAHIVTHHLSSDQLMFHKERERESRSQILSQYVCVCVLWFTAVVLKCMSSDFTLDIIMFALVESCDPFTLDIFLFMVFEDEGIPCKILPSAQFSFSEVTDCFVSKHKSLGMLGL